MEEMDDISEYDQVMIVKDQKMSEMFQNHPELQTLHSKIAKRPLEDLRVPPGSYNLNIDIAEPRYVMCSLALAVGKWLFSRGQFIESAKCFHEAYMWFPKSSEALFYLAESKRTIAKDNRDMEDYESLLRKAIALPSLTTDQISEIEVGHMKEFIEKCAKKLLLYLLQSSRTAEADEILHRADFHWRISEKVMNYSDHWCAPKSKSLSQFITVVDDFLLPDQYSHLCDLFRKDSVFWKEHDYDPSGNFSKKVGYFSYLYPFRKRSATCSIEQIIDAVYKVMLQRYPVLEEALIAEWWVHSRPHSNGHQMHFDSDETRIGTGGTPKHPIASCVLYLGEAGGPTIVTNQTLAGNLATEGWLIPPKTNRLTSFDASYLHGVVPGKGINPTTSDRRLTFMVGFWRAIEAKDLGVNKYGPGQPFPCKDSKFTWHKELDTKEEWAARDVSSLQTNLDCVGHVDEVWVQLDDKSVQQNYKDFFQGF